MRIPRQQKRSYTWRWTAALGGLAVLAFALAFGLVVSPTTEVQAANFTVNLLTDVPDLDDTNGDGAFNAGETGGTTACDTDAVTTGNQCTLRAAIFEANRNGDTTDTITFGTLSGTITLATASLPVGATAAASPPADGTTIDGNGSVTVSCAAPFAGFAVTGGGNVIRDLAITNCVTGIFITGEAADGNAIRGNRIGVNMAGTAPAGNLADGVSIIAGPDNNIIGGTTTADQNIISANGFDGVYIMGASTTGNTVLGNLIGVDVTGVADFGNTWEGVEITGGATSNVVGGLAGGSRNVISGNDLNGVLIDGAGTSNNIVEGNCIGTQGDCASPRPNTLNGVRIAGGATDNFVGTGTAGSGNVIANNLLNGVDITGGVTTDDNMISRNSMSGNGDCGIQLGALENDSQAVGPAPTSITFNGGTSFTIAGAGAVPGGTVQAFISSADPAPCTGCGLVASGEGSCYVGEAIADGGGNFSIQVNNIGGASIVLTDTNTTNSTSEFGGPPFGAPAGPGPGLCPLPGAAVPPTPTPAATNTPAPTSTSAPAGTSTPAATVTPGGPTSTPTTGPTEAVSLVAGCNNEASTWPDNTDIETIAAGVDPADALTAIWYYRPATRDWLGYSPDVPANVNDLDQADRLEPLFFCVDRAATLHRPLV